MKNQIISFHSTKDIEPLLEEIADLIFRRLKSNPDMTFLLLLICGLLNKTYELTESAIWALDHDRPQTAAFMLRGLYETLAFTFYIECKLTSVEPKDRQEAVNTLLFGSKKPGSKYQSVNILTCIEKATKRFDKLKNNYEELSEYVHPNAASHFYVALATNDREMQASIEIPFYKFKNTDKKASLNQVGECCFHIIRISKELVKLS